MIGALTLRRALTALLVAALVATSLAASAQTASELEALRRDVDALRREVGEVRKLLEQMRQPPPRADAAPAGPVKVRIGGAGVALGRPDAPVTIVEFSDYQCPFCQRYTVQTFPELKRDYIDTGKVRYVLRDFPLDNIHPDARKAAESAHCAGDQGKYWEMHEALFRNIRMLKPEQLKEHAKALGLDEAAFAECLDKGRYAATVNENFTAGRALGVTATPTFFVGRTTRDGTMEATQVRGAQPTANFRKAIDALLETKAGG